MSKSTHGWEACPQGELTKLSAALVFQRKLRIAALVGFVFLAGAGLAGAGWIVHSALKSAQPDCAPCHDATPPCDEGAGNTPTP